MDKINGYVFVPVEDIVMIGYKAEQYAKSHKGTKLVLTYVKDKRGNRVAVLHK